MVIKAPPSADAIEMWTARINQVADDDGWRVRTDHGVTLAEPWGRDLFRRLADDLPADRI